MLQKVPVGSLFGFGLSLFTLVVLTGVMVFDAELFKRLVSEDGPVEYLGFLFLLGCAAVLFATAWRARRSLRLTLGHAFAFGLAGVAFLVAAGEEISWGQRIIGFRTPEALVAVNDQGEFNLHNIEKGPVDMGVRYALALFVIFGMSMHALGKRRFLGFTLPDVLTTQVFLLSCCYLSADLVDKPFLLAVSGAAVALGYAALRRRWQEVGVGGITLGAIALLTGVDTIYASHMPMNSTPEVREMLLGLGCLMFSLKLFRHAMDLVPDEEGGAVFATAT